MVGVAKVINTVTGKITKKQLGTTYIHEHLYVVPNDLPKYYDYTLDDIDKSIYETFSFKNVGGNSLVDLTPINYGRSPLLLKKISEATGVNILFVTGFHKEEFQPKWLEKLNSSQVYDFLTHEIVDGATSQHLKPGAMKLGTSLNQVTASEKKVIEIEARVQRDLRIPIITHCDKGTMGLEQLKILQENGAELSHVCLSHVDLAEDVSYIEEIFKQGASISFDHVGRSLTDCDSKDVEMITQLVNDGFVDQICLAGDMGRKKYFNAYNGKPGLKYILTSLKKELLKHMNLQDFNKMVQDNPQRILEM